MGEFEQDVAGIGALADPVRRALYEFVCAQDASVSRDQAAEAVRVAHHQAKFHLDKLEAEGLLETEYARVGGRSGPGAGRSSKLYRRSSREIAVSLPVREYELAGRLMADAIAASTGTGTPVLQALHHGAVERGRAIGDAAVGRNRDKCDAFDLAIRALADNGYQPRRDGDRVIMTNCPFHALAQAHTQLVCTMNHALLTGVLERVAPHHLWARLEPGDSRCCVVLARSADVSSG